jgi:hypothetical protein
MENEKAINNLLDFLSGSPDIKEYYDMTLQQLEKNGNKVWRSFRIYLNFLRVLASV